MPFKERLKSGEPRKRAKQCHVPKDWSQYNQSLRKRGMLGLYLPKGELRTQLINEESYRTGQSGREPFYTPAYVALLFLLGSLHRFGLREFAGYMHDYWRERGIDLPVPQLWTSVGPVCRAGHRRAQPVHACGRTCEGR